MRSGFLKIKQINKKKQKKWPANIYSRVTGLNFLFSMTCWYYTRCVHHTYTHCWASAVDALPCYLRACLLLPSINRSRPKLCRPGPCVYVLRVLRRHKISDKCMRRAGVLSFNNCDMRRLRDNTHRMTGRLSSCVVGSDVEEEFLTCRRIKQQKDKPGSSVLRVLLNPFRS